MAVDFTPAVVSRSARLVAINSVIEVDLFGQADIDTRAERLIQIAAPPFRDALADAWAELRRAL
jgi:acyl-CoA hydrolase